MRPSRLSHPYVSTTLHRSALSRKLRGYWCSVDEAAIESLFLNNPSGVGNSDQAARRGGAGKQESRLLDPKRLQNVAIMLKVLNVTSSDVIGALMHGEFVLSVLYKSGPQRSLEFSRRSCAIPMSTCPHSTIWLLLNKVHTAT